MPTALRFFGASLAAASLVSSAAVATAQVPGSVYTVVIPAGEFGSPAYTGVVVAGIESARRFCAGIDDDYKVDCLGCHEPARKTDLIYEQGYPVLHD